MIEQKLQMIREPMQKSQHSDDSNLVTKIIAIPGLDLQDIAVTEDNDVLTVTIPKSELGFFSALNLKISLIILGKRFKTEKRWC